MKIRILKPDIISKYKLDEYFEFMDKLKNDIQNTLKIQEESSEKSCELSDSYDEEYETIIY